MRGRGARPRNQRGHRPQDGAHPPAQRAHQQGQRLAGGRAQQGERQSHHEKKRVKI